jgi:RsmE family RNA methyltransferase
MNLILLFPSDFIEENRIVRLEGRRKRHILEVHRAMVGDSLKIGLVNSQIGTGTIIGLNDKYIDIEIHLDLSPPQPLALTLILALPRPKSLRRVIQGATAMGVKKFILIRTWRVEKSYFQSPMIGEEAIKQHFVSGLEQGCDTIMPKLEIRKLFRPFIEDEIPMIIADTVPLLAHPGTQNLCPFNIKKRVTLAVGPEGGFIQYELDMLVKHGFMPVSLGSRPIRVEDAVAALLGRLFQL